MPGVLFLLICEKNILKENFYKRGDFMCESVRCGHLLKAHDALKIIALNSRNLHKSANLFDPPAIL